MDNILFFDVETPDKHHTRICQIGIICDDLNGNTIFCKSFLINPEIAFDEMNMQVHGITPKDVKDAPTFPDVWKEIGPYFKSSLLIAHNTPFDLAVLDKTLLYYKIPFDVANFLDTKEKASELHDIEDCKLDTLCSYFGVELLHHHDALADTRACREIYKGLKDKVGWRESDVKVKWFGQCHLKMDSNSITTSMKVLEGIR